MTSREIIRTANVMLREIDTLLKEKGKVRYRSTIGSLMECREHIQNFKDVTVGTKEATKGTRRSMDLLSAYYALTHWYYGNPTPLKEIPRKKVYFLSKIKQLQEGIAEK